MSDAVNQLSGFVQKIPFLGFIVPNPVFMAALLTVLVLIIMDISCDTKPMHRFVRVFLVNMAMLALHFYMLRGEFDSSASESNSKSMVDKVITEQSFGSKYAVVPQYQTVAPAPVPAPAPVSVQPAHGV